MKLLDYINQDELVKSQHLDGTVNPPAADRWTFYEAVKQRRSQ
jgi:hypothetical protein